MNFAWIKVNHISYICEITQVDFLNKKCKCRIGDVEFTEVPFSEFQNIRDELLPWQKCETCAYHDDWTWACFNPEANDRADFTDESHVCDCWRERTVFKLIQSTPVSGDCICGYNVKLDREYTVKDFIDTVLSERTREWGCIGIYDQSDFVGRYFGNPNMEYSHGKILTSNFTEDILRKEVKDVSASGGWSRMDYILKV